MGPYVYRRLALALVTAGIVAASLAWPQAQQGGGGPIAIDADDIAGVVTGPKGPEAGVWVIAETTSLPTKFTEIVVTDDRGRYLLPDLPKATYNVWVRGYGLVDSPKVQVAPGKMQNLTATVAPDARAAADYYPANYWLSLLQFPPASEFPGTGPEGNGIPTMFRSQDEWVNAVKCANCHQIGNKVTRELRKNVGTFHSSADAWDARVKFGQSGVPMSGAFDRPGRARNMKLWADWTDRIAAGEYPMVAPPRPRGVERNVVLKMWDWGGPSPYQLVHDEVVTDRRNPTVNANGLVWGTGDGAGNIVWLDPVKHTTGEIPLPTLDKNPDWASNFGPRRLLAPSPIWGNRLTWDPRAPHTPMMDQKGRVWLATKIRDPEDQPEFCKSGSTNKFAAYYPLNGPAGYHATVYDPRTKETSMIDTCFGGSHLMFGEDKDNTLFYSVSNQFGWINTRIFDETKDGVAAQGWAPAVLDTNGDGKISKGWTEPNQPVDPTKDHRVEFGCYSVVINPVDGTVWCPPARFPGTLTRMDLGSNPPETAKAEQYEVPPGTGFNPRGMDFDRNGVAWISFAGSGHMASFDRRKCKVLNGPTATGQHCVEGWKFYEDPSAPKMKGTRAGADYFYMSWVDQHDTLGLGKDIPMTQGSNSDSLIALMPQTGEWVTLRVPYPMGMFTRSHDGRIDNPNGGWKGRAVWTTNATAALWHTEGGVGQKSKVVKMQVRPDPLAK